MTHAFAWCFGVWLAVTALAANAPTGGIGGVVSTGGQSAIPTMRGMPGPSTVTGTLVVRSGQTVAIRRDGTNTVIHAGLVHQAGQLTQRRRTALDIGATWALRKDYGAR